MNTNADDLPVVPLAPAAADAARDAEFAEAPPTAPADAAQVQAQCANCGKPLLGPHCYACGQPVKGMVRHLSSILADAADTILNIDSRIFRTLPALYLRPGFLTNEYFAGRRVRYVTPFRLYFFLSIAAFFLIQFAVGDLDLHGVNVNVDAQESINSALTKAEVEKQRDLAIANLKNVEAGLSGNAKATKKIESAIERIQTKAEQRSEYLDKVEAAKAKGEAAPPEPNRNVISFDGTPWDAKKHPVSIGWLPQFPNDKNNPLAARAQQNMARIASDPKPFLIAAIGALPTVLFVLMPVFAFLLKIFYIFKRRLYMEHVVVALHSHAFIFLALLLLTLAVLASGWAAQSAPWLHTLLEWIVFAMGWWLPIYLLIMQKRVYKQGWFLTIVKYCTIGIAYSVLIGLGVGAAFIVSLATT